MLLTTVNDNRRVVEVPPPTKKYTDIAHGTAFEATHMGSGNDDPGVYLKLQGPLSGAPMDLLYRLDHKCGTFGNRWSDQDAPAIIKGYKPIKLTISFEYE